jgi:hypothetical protein
MGPISLSYVSSLNPKSFLCFSKEDINLLPGPFCANGRSSNLAPNRLERSVCKLRSIYVEPHLPPMSQFQQSLNNGNSLRAQILPAPI